METRRSKSSRGHWQLEVWLGPGLPVQRRIIIKFTQLVDVPGYTCIRLSFSASHGPRPQLSVISRVILASDDSRSLNPHTLLSPDTFCQCTRWNQIQGVGILVHTVRSIRLVEIDSQESGCPCRILPNLNTTKSSTGQTESSWELKAASVKQCVFEFRRRVASISKSLGIMMQFFPQLRKVTT
eukprot:1381417-Rhodomonas_salina.2